LKSILGEEDDGANAAALMQEALFTGLLEHPNIVPVHQLGRSADDKPLLVMKRVEGVSWEALIKDPAHAHWKTLGEDRLKEHLTILSAVCNAVEFAHARGVLHRDIKPANVMVGAFGEVYLLDWGLAMRLDKRPEQVGIVGTPCQMAPEMLDGAKAVDERTDVYLLGAALHSALTGAHRHTGNSLRSLCYAAYKSEPVDYPPDVPEELATLCNRATHVDPAQRPASAAEFRLALERYLEHRSSNALAREASAGLASLRALLAEDAPDRARVAGLFAECRFGFAQALRAWPQNPVAREGLQACLTLVLERELAQGNLSLAEALLADLPQPAPELEARVAAQRQAADAQAALLRERARQGDWRQGAAWRLVFFVGFIGFWVAVWLWTNGWQVRYEGTHSPERLAGSLGLPLLVLCVLVFLGRRQLLTNEVNARLVGGVLITGFALFAQRLANCVPAPPTASLISSEILFCALGSALGGLTLARWLWLQVPIWLVGAFAARLLPAYAGLCFASFGLLALAVGAWQLYTSAMAAGESGEAPAGS
ncbi:MAG: serine/threonine protein kinase, partial [Planctomycetes bacterium]|nr:serine/threonine protein kinase [Planctomycetota bacterium]